MVSVEVVVTTTIVRAGVAMTTVEAVVTEALS